MPRARSGDKIRRDKREGRHWKCKKKNIFQILKERKKMCKKPKGLHNRIDKCMKPLIKFLNEIGFDTLSCCCGHDRYPMTIIVKLDYGEDTFIYELFTEIDIPRTRNFYKKDKKGYYYIPEISNKK